VLRFIGALSIIFAFIIEAAITEFFSFCLATHPRVRNRIIAELMSRYADRLLHMLQIKCDFERLPKHLEGGLIACNHISYIDALVISKAMPSFFITSVEVRNSWGLGLISRLCHCIFVERRNRLSLDVETHTIEKALRENIPVVLFPEGTSTDGAKILPFRPALYQSAINAHSTVHNFHIQYDHPSVAYYGTMEFVSHLIKLCRQGPCWATLTYLGETNPTLDCDRKWIAQKSYEKVLENHVCRV